MSGAWCDELWDCVFIVLLGGAIIAVPIGLFVAEGRCCGATGWCWSFVTFTAFTAAAASLTF